MNKMHQYTIKLDWTGNLGKGTADYKSYSRAHEIQVAGKPMIPASSDPGFRGDPARYNPEDLLVSSVSGCHMLWYLHLCSVNGITVVDYQDNATGEMEESANGSGRFVKLVLRPHIQILEADKHSLALELHHKANEFCFIANSVNFPVTHEPEILIKGAGL